jgi:hypothetical protein
MIFLLKTQNVTVEKLKIRLINWVSFKIKNKAILIKYLQSFGMFPETQILGLDQ